MILRYTVLTNKPRPWSRDCLSQSQKAKKQEEGKKAWGIAVIYSKVLEGVGGSTGDFRWLKVATQRTYSASQWLQTGSTEPCKSGILLEALANLVQTETPRKRNWSHVFVGTKGSADGSSKTCLLSCFWSDGQEPDPDLWNPVVTTLKLKNWHWSFPAS